MSDDAQAKDRADIRRAWRQLRLTSLPAMLALAASTDAAEIRREQYAYSSERSCVSGGKIPVEQCGNAAANAQAAFDARAPRFATRGACEKVFVEAGCSLGFKGNDGWAGKPSGIYFSPRQLGFKITVSGREAMVTPFTSGPHIEFESRSALERNTRIDFTAARKARDAWKPRGAETSAAFGVSTSTSGEIPPPPPVDPNFDCAAVMEPSAKDHPDTGCYLAPPRRRR